MTMNSMLSLLVVLLVHGTLCVDEDCAVGEYIRGGRCTSCFEKFPNERTPCRDLCTNGYPERKCVNTCSFYCIDEWCQAAANSCIQGCAKGWYGDSCNRRCANGCKDDKCDRHGNCTCKIGWYGYQCNMQCPQNCSEEGCDFKEGKCIYGCKKHWFGDKCDKQCSTNCKSSLCDNKNGSCTYGCNPSWYGNKCDQQCPTNCKYYYVDCTDIVCDGCKPGYRGSSCDTPCPSNCELCDQHLPDKCFTCQDGWYGSVCEKRCDNCRSKMCDMYGNCTLGCWKNYFGRKCEACSLTCLVTTGSASTCYTENGTCKHGCEERWFGDRCELNCSSGCRDGRCDRLTGTCIGGCLNTSYGPYCDAACNTGCSGGICDETGVCTGGCNVTMYGPYCNNTCSVGCKGEQCNQTTGVCTEGCKAPFYGLNCSNNCSSNCINSYCQMDESELKCSHGCKDGWWGSYCQEQCPQNCPQCVNGTGCDEGGNSAYGTYDNQTCSARCVEQDCDITGVCRHGCVHGWMGEKCQISTLSVIISGCTVGVLLIAGVLLFLVRRKVFKAGCIKEEHTDQESIVLSMMRKLTDSMPLLNVETYVNKSSVTTKIPIHQFKKYVNKQRITNGLVKQFRRLPVNPVYPCYEGDLPQSAVKNRYGNILPYDHNRVVLVTDSVSLSSDYINASYIEGYERSQPFIATQGPFCDVMTAFWQMIWQKDVQQIVMLTNCVENGRKKCEQYWPDFDQTQMITPDITVQCVDERKERDFTIRTFNFTKEGHPSREIKQFHFTTWPDNDVPDNVTSLQRLHTAVTSCAASACGHVLVHCSAGIGRTGTYIALDYLIQQAKSEGVVDVFECVLRLRHQRMNMVHTEEQYVLIHDVLLQVIDSHKSLNPIHTVTDDIHTTMLLK